MRPIDRIERILGKLQYLWKKNPDSRLFQLLLNVLPEGQSTCLHCLHHREWFEVEEWIDDKINEKDNV